MKIWCSPKQKAIAFVANLDDPEAHSSELSLTHHCPPATRIHYCPCVAPSKGITVVPKDHHSFRFVFGLHFKLVIISKNLGLYQYAVKPILKH